jgi:EmrB/QacA subfamily drug resistance transporter
VVLGLACAGQFMVVLDVSVVNVALPSIRRGLGFEAASLQWVVTSYSLVFAGFLLLGGRLADLYGRKRVFTFGLLLFSAASLVGGIANSPALLVAARAVQGLGAAVLAPATLTILTTTFGESERRAKALGAWTAVGAAGGAAGNLVGGVLTEYLSWRWTLLINVPIGAVVVLLALPLLPVGRAAEQVGTRLDVPGALLATAGLTTLVYGVAQADPRGWGDGVTLAALGIGAALLVAFVFVEARLTRAPLMPLRLFGNRSVSAGNGVMVLVGAAFIPMWYFLSLSMQNVLGYSALRTGIAYLPHTTMIVVGSRAAPYLMKKTGDRLLIMAGATIAAVGFVWQSRITADSGYVTGILGPALLMCLGLGLLMPPVTSAVTSGVAHEDAGIASGLMNAARQVGGSLGLAVLATTVAAGGHTGPASATGYGHAFLTIAGVLGAVVTLSCALPAGRVRDAKGNSPGTEEEEAAPAWAGRR